MKTNKIKYTKDHVERIIEYCNRTYFDNELSTTLAILTVGDDYASQIYVRNKIKMCERANIMVRHYSFPADTKQEEVIWLINFLNDDYKTNGIIVQLPLPDHIDKTAVMDAINPLKDADGFHRNYIYDLFRGKEPIVEPCTPKGIMEILSSNVDLSGLHVAILGRSTIVGKPLAMMLENKDATVTLCHSKTKNLEKITQNADVVICAMGKPKFLKKEMIKEGAIVIDVGINRDENGKLCGDADLDDLIDKVSWITPVPGGVGPMTVAILCEQTVGLAIRQKYCE